MWLDFFAILDHVLARLHSHGRVTYNALQLQCHLDDTSLISVVVRYPDDLSEMVSQYPEASARDYFERTKELLTWLRQDPRLQTS